MVRIAHVFTAIALVAFVVVSVLTSGPAPECDPAAVEALRPLNCREAVGMAERALAGEHPTITRRQFLAGSAEPIFFGLRAGEGVARTFVVFTYADAQREFVNLTMADGTMYVGEPKDY
jgi:hypothetical protein